MLGNSAVEKLLFERSEQFANEQSGTKSFIFRIVSWLCNVYTMQTQKFAIVRSLQCSFAFFHLVAIALTTIL